MFLDKSTYLPKNQHCTYLTPEGSSPMFVFIRGERRLVEKWQCYISSIYCVRKIFQETNISYPLIYPSTCAYQDVRNVSFSETFAYVLNGWPPKWLLISIWSRSIQKLRNVSQILYQKWIYLSIYQSIYLSIYQSIYLSIYLSIYPSLYAQL